MATTRLETRYTSWSAVTLFIINALLMVTLYSQYANISYLVYMLLMALLLFINFIPFYEALHTKQPTSTKCANIITTIGNILYMTPPPVWVFMITTNSNFMVAQPTDCNKANLCWRYISHGCSLDYLYIQQYSLYLARRPRVEINIFAAGVLIYIITLCTIIQKGYLLKFVLVYYIPQRLSLLMVSCTLWGGICVLPRHTRSVNELSGGAASPIYKSLQLEEYHSPDEIKYDCPGYDYREIYLHVHGNKIGMDSTS